MRHSGDTVRKAIIEGTVNAVACYGLDGATTKRISADTKINEAYIYREFKSKDHLLASTFAALDAELVSEVMLRLPIMDVVSMDVKQRCMMFFFSVWKFILGKPRRCICYIQYYYSQYFTKYSKDEHLALYVPLVEKFTSAFKEGTNVSLLFGHIMHSMLDFAVKVFNGYLKDDEETAKYVFDIIYSSVESRFLWSK